MFNKMIVTSNGLWQAGRAIILKVVAGNGKLMKEWNGSKREFRNIRWNKQGTYLATASDALRIWTKMESYCIRVSHMVIQFCGEPTGSVIQRK